MNMTTIQPFSLFPTPLFFGNGPVLLDPNHVWSPEVLQDGLRASWWAPAFADGAAATVVGDVAGAINPPYTPPSPNFDLTPNGTPTVSFASKWDRAVALNGSTDYFSTADHADLRITAGQSVTFIAWVFVQAPLPNALTPIFSKWNVNDLEFALFIGNTPTVFWSLKLPNGHRYLVSQAGLPIQQWVMVRCYFDATRERAGIAIAAAAPTEAAIASADAAPSLTAPFQIGASTANAVFFKGRLDEVTRWNRLLTNQEVEWLLQNDLWNGAISYFKAASGNPIEDEQVEVDPGDTPTALSLTIDGTEVDLAWCVNALGQTWHEVWRSTDGGASARIGNASVGLSTFHDGTADTSLHSYAYKVRARNKYGASDFSDVVHSTGFADPEGGSFVDPETGGIFQDPEST